MASPRPWPLVLVTAAVVSCNSVVSWLESSSSSSSSSTAAGTGTSGQPPTGAGTSGSTTGGAGTSIGSSGVGASDPGATGVGGTGSGASGGVSGTAGNGTGGTAGSGASSAAGGASTGTGGSGGTGGIIGPPPPMCPDGTLAFPPHTPEPSPCGCPAVSGFAIDGGCGPLALGATFVKSPFTYSYFCEPEVPFHAYSSCNNGTYRVLGACTAPDTAPCIALHHDNDWGMVPQDTYTGWYIDAAGTEWSLAPLVVTYDSWNDDYSVTGTFTATATSPNAVMPLFGSFHLCFAGGISCQK